MPNSRYFSQDAQFMNTVRIGRESGAASGFVSGASWKQAAIDSKTKYMYQVISCGLHGFVRLMLYLRHSIARCVVSGIESSRARLPPSRSGCFRKA